MNRAYRALFFLSLLTGIGVTQSHATGLQAVDDRIVVVAGDEVIVNELVLANDLGSGEFIPETMPLHGHLEERVVAGEVQWVYSITEEAAAQTVGSVDDFKYRLEHGVESSNVGTVIVLTSPRWIPLAGRWWPTPNPNYAVDNLGWYDALHAEFHLCVLDAAAGELETCRRLSAPHQIIGGWPLVGDWSGDDLAELAIYDRLAGVFHLYRFPQGARELEHEATFSWNEPGMFPATGLLPVAGAWYGGAATMALYDPWQARLWRRAENIEETTTSYHPLGELDRNHLPLVGQWSASGFTTAALYNRSLHKVYFPEDPWIGGLSLQLAIGGQAPSPNAWPVPFRYPGEYTSVMLYEPAEQAFFPCLDWPQWPIGATRPVKIPSDPAGRMESGSEIGGVDPEAVETLCQAIAGNP